MPPPTQLPYHGLRGRQEHRSVLRFSPVSRSLVALIVWGGFWNLVGGGGGEIAAPSENVFSIGWTRINSSKTRENTATHNHWFLFWRTRRNRLPKSQSLKKQGSNFVPKLLATATKVVDFVLFGFHHGVHVDFLRLAEDLNHVWVPHNLAQEHQLEIHHTI